MSLSEDCGIGAGLMQQYQSLISDHEWTRSARDNESGAEVLPWKLNRAARVMRWPAGLRRALPMSRASLQASIVRLEDRP